MEIRLSKSVELIEKIKYHKEKELATHLSVAMAFKNSQGKVKLFRELIELDDEDLKYFWEKYKPKAKKAIEAGIECMQDKIKELKL